MALRDESIPEPVRPISVQVCAWCEQDERCVPMQDCVGCSHNREGEMTIWCSWTPAEKPCEGCGIPAEYCDPDNCGTFQAIKKRPTSNKPQMKNIS